MGSKCELCLVVCALGISTVFVDGASGGQVLGGFGTRGGVFDIINGHGVYADDKHQYFPGTEVSSTEELTASFLSTIDVLLISSVSSGSSHVDPPLSASEQSALLDFVKGGGGAIILTDNSSFGGLTTDQTNDSFVSAFGMDTGGHLNGSRDVTLSPANHPLLEGPIGQVETIGISWPGAITNLGPYAQSLGGTLIGSAVAVIEPNAIMPGSGGVVVVSDVAQLADRYDDLDNRDFFLNSLAFTGLLPGSGEDLDPGLCVESILEGIHIKFDEVVGQGTLSVNPDPEFDPGAGFNFFLPSTPPQFFDISFNGEFSGNVLIEFSYADVELAPGISPEDLAIVHFFEDNTFELVPGIVDEIEETITISVDEFSTFGVVAVPEPSSGALIGIATICLLLARNRILRKK